LYQQIQDTEKRASNANVTPNNPNPGSGNDGGDDYANPPKEYHVTATLKIGNTTLTASGASPSKAEATEAAEANISQKYYDYHRKNGKSDIAIETLWSRAEKNVKFNTPQYYARGTLGTKRDELAITDESWIGEEITLAAGKNGQLQYLKKGSAVMPADISANLVEWGKLNPNMLNVDGTPNINMINNAVNKPEFNFNVDNFLRCDNVSQDSLPELKQFVKEQMDTLVKQMNYSIKRFSR
jgi:hypothetical protein